MDKRAEKVFPAVGAACEKAEGERPKVRSTACSTHLECSRRGGGQRADRLGRPHPHT